VTPYLAVLSARFRVLLQYRAAAVAGILTQLAWGLIRMMIFDAFYRASSGPQPMRHEDVITYVWLSQAFFHVFPLGADADVRAMVRTGTVVYELLRPADLHSLWFARALAQRTAPTFLRAVPLLIVAGLFLGLEAPPSVASFGAWVLTFGSAVLLASAFTTLLTITLLWTISGEGISRFAPQVAYVFSGLLVPIPLLPSWIRPFVEALPFRGIVDVPARAWSGNLTVAELPATLAHQLGWTVALVVIGRVFLARSMRRLVAQGG
jgi:ABC-2 type transport system permease protein